MKHIKMTVTVPKTVPAPAPAPTPTPTPSLELRRVRKWGDPIMVAGPELDTGIVNTSNFQAVGLWNNGNNEFGGVSNFLRIPHEDVMRVQAMQITDDYTPFEKMRWLCNAYRGKIYMWDNPDDNWETDAIRWGTIALGGNLVQVEEYVTMSIVTPNMPLRNVVMSKLKGFTPNDWGRPLNDLVAEGIVHRCYCAYRTPKENTFGDSPRGIVYNPFYSPQYWDFAGVAQPTHLYIPEEWLEDV